MREKRRGERGRKKDGQLRAFCIVIPDILLALNENMTWRTLAAVDDLVQ